eukprot:6087050-Prymnesium_polylepis.2
MLVLSFCSLCMLAIARCESAPCRSSKRFAARRYCLGISHQPGRLDRSGARAESARNMSSGALPNGGSTCGLRSASRSATLSVADCSSCSGSVAGHRRLGVVPGR